MHIVDVSIMINNKLYGKDKHIVPNFNLYFKTLVGQANPISWTKIGATA